MILSKLWDSLGVVQDIFNLRFTASPLYSDSSHSSLQRIPQYTPIIKLEEGQKKHENKTAICQKMVEDRKNVNTRKIVQSLLSCLKVE